jgi:hypothetical protein
MLGKGNRSTRKIPSAVPLCPPQIPHDLTRARTWAAEVGSRRLSSWAMVRLRPTLCHYTDLRSLLVFFL